MTPPDSARIKAIFEHIAPGYDAGNDRVSFGMHRLWKHRLAYRVAQLAPADGQVLDVCCGTGDLCVALTKANPRLTVKGIDFSPAMLEVARRKTQRLPQVALREGDALALPWPDSHFDVSVICFGLRNVPQYQAALREMARVTKPGGTVLCFESSVPEDAFIRAPYRLFFHHLMPLLGGDEDYRYLYQSTEAFLSKAQLAQIFRGVGLSAVRYRSFFLETCALHIGRVIKGGPA